MLDFAESTGRFFENLLLGILLTGMILVACSQILLRDFGFGTLIWGDEAVRLAVLWIAMIAGVAAAREDRHISIDVLSRFLPPRGKALAALLVGLFTAGACLALAWFSWRMVSYAIEDGEVLLGGQPAWIFQAILPIAFFLMAWRYLIWAIRRGKQFVTGEDS
jgi:TRAP-type C4-dicarboxylate transport system permease small subunit